MGINIYMVNVGDGDAIILTLKRRQKKAVVLIDGGNKRYTKKVRESLENILTREGKKAPDLIVCTHYDQDHICGIIQIVKEYQDDIKKIWVHRPHQKYKKIMNVIREALNSSRIDKRAAVSDLSDCFDENSKLRREAEFFIETYNQLQDLIKLIKEYEIPLEEPFGYPENTYLDGFPEFKVIGPTRNFYNQFINTIQENRIDLLLEKQSEFRELINEVINRDLPACDRLPNSSRQKITSTNMVSIIILYTDDKQRKYLFPGDAGIESFKSIPCYRSLLQNLYYLIIPHHGSRKNISKALIEIMKPEVGLISAKGDKEHPHRDVVECLAAHGVDIYQTKDYQNGIDSNAIERNRRIRFKDIYYSGEGL